jgi:hypothetical protein
LSVTRLGSATPSVVDWNMKHWERLRLEFSCSLSRRTYGSEIVKYSHRGSELFNITEFYAQSLFEFNERKGQIWKVNRLRFASENRIQRLLNM